MIFLALFGGFLLALLWFILMRAERKYLASLTPEQLREYNEQINRDIQGY